MISDGMVRGLKEYFEEYKGCRNCKHRPEPLQMCERGRWQTCIELICSRWERREEDAETLIRRLQSAQPGWIPVTERLPDVRQWVLCQCRAGIMDVLRLTASGSWNKNYPHTEYMSGFVLAWMPLPEPYVEKDEQVRMLGKAP